jgi:hypothetical protein
MAAPPAPPPASLALTARLPWRSAVAAGVVVTLVRPATWVVALAGFLAGGGVIALAWPITVLPTTSGVQYLLGAPISTLAFGDPSPELVRAAVILGATAVVLLVAGLVVGSWAEQRMILLDLDGAADEGYTPRRPQDDVPSTGRIALLRSLSLIPPAVVFALAWSAIYSVTYQELILPEDLATPLPIRVIAKVPLQLTALIVVWLLADAAAAVGVRRLVVERRGVATAWALGWVDLARRAYRIVPIALLGDLAVLLAIGPALAAAAVAWIRVREALELAHSSPVGIAVVALWVAIWLGAVVLAGVGSALRSALFTLEGAHRP